MLRATFLLIVGSLVFAAALTPLVYTLLLTYWQDFPWPFSRVFNRVAMLGVLVMVLFLRRSFDLKSSLKFLRADWPVIHLRRLAIGFCCALMSGVVGLYLMVDGEFVLWKDTSTSQQLLKGLRWLPAAFLVAYIEEVFFRGLLFWRLVQVARSQFQCAVLAVGGSSVLYAVLHFIVPQKGFAYGSFDLFAGFKYLSLVIEQMLDPGLLFGVLGLTLVGAILAVLFLRTQALSLCIGLHAGWALSLKLANGFSTIAPEARTQVPEVLQGRYLLVAEPKVWLCLLVAGLSAYLLELRFGNKALFAKNRRSATQL
jgi:membrane protease YdiL (CAAX protease family)